MRLIHKKCPNCGAGLQFKSNDKEVTCEYCKQSFMIEGNEIGQKLEIDIDPQLVENATKVAGTAFGAVSVMSFVIFIIAFIMISGTMFFGYTQVRKQINDNKNRTNNTNVITDKYVKEFSEIDKDAMDVMQSTALNKLATQKVYNRTYTEGTWEYVGMYLLNVKEDKHVIYKNILYLVYKMDYVNSKTGMVVPSYAVIEYTDLKLSDDNVVVSKFYGSLSSPMRFVDGGTSSYIYGYESINDLYVKLVRSNTNEYEIKATEDWMIVKS